MIEPLHFVLAFIAGVLVKLVDDLEDERKTSSALKYPLALAYGLIIGYLIGSSAFSVLFLAALIAQVFARKIDTISHKIGFTVAILSLLAFGFPPLDIPLFAFFLILAFLDEADFLGKLHPITEYRLVLKAGALLMVAFGRWDYFAGIICFDIGYEAVRRLTRHIK
ncbi:MAG: hypothetical protein U0R44_06730 [Candidatus Micrarchaeia archaeon]